MRAEKWHGAGNDFLVADGRGDAPGEGWSEWARRACDRHRGIGADGLLVLATGPDEELAMRYWNADGSGAEMCGNGGRVLAAYAAARGLAGDGRVRFRSAWGEHEAAVSEDAPGRYRVQLSLPDVPPPQPIRVPTPWGEAGAYFVTAGVPHLVLRAEETPAAHLEDVPVLEWGRALRRSPLPGGLGANVDFVAMEAASRLRLRTYERGVEAETLSCGTGAVAAVAAARAWRLGDSPWEVTPWSGESLRVSYSEASGVLTTVRLSGPAVRVGSVEL